MCMERQPDFSAQKLRLICECVLHVSVYAKSFSTCALTTSCGVSRFLSCCTATLVSSSLRSLRSRLASSFSSRAVLPPAFLLPSYTTQNRIVTRCFLLPCCTTQNRIVTRCLPPALLHTPNSIVTRCLRWPLDSFVNAKVLCTFCARFFLSQKRSESHSCSCAAPDPIPCG